MRFIQEQLTQNKNTFKNLLKDLEEQLILWRPKEDKWNLLEIVCHLYDEEREDFRFRIKWLFEKPNQTPPPFNPINWITEHNYSEQDYTQMVSKFLDEREQSLIWLNNLIDAPWNNSFIHNKLGQLSAKYFLENWLAHDYLHIRQITKQKFDYLNEQSQSNLDYAGKW